MDRENCLTGITLYKGNSSEDFVLLKTSARGGKELSCHASGFAHRIPLA